MIDLNNIMGYYNEQLLIKLKENLPLYKFEFNGNSYLITKDKITIRMEINTLSLFNLISDDKNNYLIDNSEIYFKTLCNSIENCFNEI